jgi:putative SOS response-associated peptidase YedK
MCYHTVKNFDAEALFDHYNASFESIQISDDVKTNWHPLYRDSGFDNNYSPVLTSNGIGMYKWGIIPPKTSNWAQAEILNKKTLNCVHEDMYHTPSFKDAAEKHRRCLIPVAGFFESQHINYGRKEPLKQPYYIYLDKKLKLFSLAGLWSVWQDPQGNAIRTFTVLTAPANAFMSKIHNSALRMPVIIKEENYADWLSPDLTLDEETKLCRPSLDGRLHAYTVSEVVKKRKPTRNDPDPANYEGITDEVPPLPIPQTIPGKSARRGGEGQSSLF